MSTWLRALLVSFSFLTRLPVNPSSTGEVNDEDMGRSVAFFPLVGLLLGLGAVALGYTHVRGFLSSSLAAVLIVAFLAALTGGLHLDGVADVFDGLGGGRGDRERTLAIMRDSRIGAHGATAVALLLIAKVLATRDAVDAGNLSVLLLSPALARWAVVPQLAWYPYARPEGLGRAFRGTVRMSSVAIATGIVAVTIALVAIAFGRGGWWPSLWALGLSLGYGQWMSRRLGGLTGDVYGATIEMCEVAILFASATQ